MMNNEERKIINDATGLFKEVLSGAKHFGDWNLKEGTPPMDTRYGYRPTDDMLRNQYKVGAMIEQSLHKTTLHRSTFIALVMYQATKTIELDGVKFIDNDRIMKEAFVVFNCVLRGAFFTEKGVLGTHTHLREAAIQHDQDMIEATLLHRAYGSIQKKSNYVAFLLHRAVTSALSELQCSVGPR